MYYVNQEQLAVRLQVLPELAAALDMISASWQGTLLEGLAQERALHLALETVTDVGSFLIDGFIMRDASSYEDIIDIIASEGVFSAEELPMLLQLVKLRKPLVQDYYEWPRSELHPLSLELPKRLLSFKQAVEAYLARELE
ncbi:DUF86 domain-containing protein [Paenibacillus sp. GCM10023252]|uniref:DUF86 domain-containing protein n=1 Tax=Paenibacillus sp. GCM10023252 TaxID=3252649 RepID=UPI00360CA590